MTLAKETFFTVLTTCDGKPNRMGEWCQRWWRLPEVFLHQLCERDHGVRTTNLDEFDDASGRSVELNFTTLESVVSGAVTPWDRRVVITSEMLTLSLSKRPTFLAAPDWF